MDESDIVTMSSNNEANTFNQATWTASNVTGNGWTRDICITTQEISLTINVVAMCMGLFITLGNLLVLFVLYKYPAKRFTPFNWLLCHLAVADIAIGSTVFWWYGLAEILGIPITLFQKTVFYSISIVAVLGSFEGLMMIAIDRYLLILRQRKYAKFITRRRLAITIAVMWLFPALIELVGPLLGWSCVAKCDCRIHNLAPDDVYCFGEECSQILPPLTKHQLFFASCSSFVIFLITLVFYICIFNGVKKQSKKLKRIMNSCRTVPTTNNSATFSRQSPNIHRNEHQFAPSPNDGKREMDHAAWRHNLAVLEERKSAEMRSSMRVSTSNKIFENHEKHSEVFHDENSFDGDPTSYIKERLRTNTTSSCEEPQRKMVKQESKSSILTTITNLSLSPDEDSAQDNLYVTNTVVRYSKTGDIANGSPDASRFREHSLRPTSLDIPVKPRPKIARKKRKQSSTNDLRKSITQNVVKTFNLLALKTGRQRRTSASRKRDLRIMKSMFMIMSVFVLTTGPLVLFIIYTFINNDRDLKEIFNVLLQVTTLNSLLNPILYFWRLPQMRKKFLKLVRARYWQEKFKISTTCCRRKTSTTPKDADSGASGPSWESSHSEE